LDTVASLRRSLTNWIVTPDRIAEQAKANKRLTYVDFGNKEQLFETIVGRALGEPADAVPFTPNDLPGYAAALFDHLIGCPQLMQDPTSPERLAAHRAAVATAVRLGRAGRRSKRDTAMHLG
jgi:AcrR family transcriptional regulator